jgi:hypothetical protein
VGDAATSLILSSGNPAAQKFELASELWRQSIAERGEESLNVVGFCG